MNFEQITTEDNERYLAHLRQCKEIPCNVAPGFIWGYLEIAPCERAYEDGLCWQRLTEHGKTRFCPPLGDWDNVDWPRILEKNLHPGDTFIYVPEYLKNLWEQAAPGRFEVTTNRNDWDYIYELNSFCNGLTEQKRLVKKFKELYTAEFEKITKDNAAEILDFSLAGTQKLKEKHPNDDFRELDEDDIALEKILQNWGDQDAYESLVMRVDGRIVSFLTWNEIDERVIGLYNKNDYSYKGVLAAIFEEMSRTGIMQGKKYLNHCNDAGIEGLRQAKMERKPIKLLEKYTMTWN